MFSFFRNILSSGKYLASYQQGSHKESGDSPWRAVFKRVRQLRMECQHLSTKLYSNSASSVWKPRLPVALGWDIRFHLFLITATDWSAWSASCCGRWYDGTHWVQGWEGPRPDLDVVGMRIILPYQELDPVRLTRSQSLNRIYSFVVLYLLSLPERLK